tara:strand:- start:93 stop:275 length:183 start_codon:yes stop_codon:yes gene_type:complete
MGKTSMHFKCAHNIKTHLCFEKKQLKIMTFLLPAHAQLSLIKIQSALTKKVKNNSIYFLL